MTRRRCHRCHRHAFSLIEVLVAITLLLALSGSIFGFLFNLLSTREQVQRHAATQLAATTLIDRIEQDLMACMVGDDTVGSGVEGTNERLVLLTRSVAIEYAERGIDDPVPFGDLQRSEYQFRAGARTVDAKRTAVTETVRLRQPFASLGGELHHVRFRFYDGEAWRERYDALAAGRLPVAIEVAIWFNPWPSDEEEDPDATGEEEEDLPPLLAEDPFEEAMFEDEAFDDGIDDDIPRPDRIRVIVIPDAAVGDGSEDDVEFSPDGEDDDGGTVR